VLGVSIDGSRQESYEQYRVRGDLEMVLRNCRLINDAKHRLGSKTPRMVWEFHVFPHNTADVAEAEALARQLDMDISVTKGWVVGKEWDPSNPTRFFWYPTPPARCHFLWQDAVVHNDGGVAPCCGTFYKDDDVGSLAISPDALGAASFREVWNGPEFRKARGFYRSRSAAAENRQHVCFDCPLTKIWEKWQVHLASGSTQPFEPGFGTNDCFNYFWDRHPKPASSPQRDAADESETLPGREASAVR
jgi:hypothetical protein